MSGWRARIPKAPVAPAGYGDAMSLINQMLQDLDARRAAHGPASGLPNDVRPLPQTPPSRLPLILGVLLLCVLGGGYAIYQWEARQLSRVPPPLVVVPSPVPVPLAVAEPAAVSVVEKNAAATRPESPEASAAAPEFASLEGSLRMADVIGSVPEKKSTARPAVPGPAPGPEKKLTAERSVPEASGRTPVSPGALPVSGRQTKEPGREAPKMLLIERNEVVGSARERAEAEYRKAIGVVNQGRALEALDGLRGALKQDALHIAARQLLVKLLIEGRRPDEAMQVLQEGLEGQPAQLGWAMTLARMQLERGDLPGAWQSLNYSMPAASANVDYQGFAGHVLQRLGRYKEAAEHYQQALRLSPGEGRWWLGLGLALEADGRGNEAREAFLRARQSGTLSSELMALVEQKLR